MAKSSNIRKNKKGGVRNLVPFIIIIIVIIIGLPYLLLNYQSNRSGKTIREVIGGILSRSGKTEQFSGTGAEVAAGPKIDFLEAVPVGLSFTEPPMISNIAVADLDKNGLPDIVVCDAKNNFVSCISQYPGGIFTEEILARDIIAPAHAQVIDFDNDGDYDIVIAVLGMLFPNNDKIGSVIVLENTGKSGFIKHICIEKIARVSDVRAGDMDNDGDMDLVVAQFGYDDGETRWLENLGSWQFRSHILQNLSGPINVVITDIDKDGDLDFFSLVSQEWEEIYCFINDGKANFQPRLIYKSSNEDFGSSWLSVADIDLDGDEDILYTNGDAFDYIPPQPRPWHGIQWLENKGGMNFEFHRICNFAGAYGAKPVDIDKDGDLDLFSVSAFNLWEKPSSQSFIWLENTGNMQYIIHDISSNPTHLLSLETGDFNNDGLMDMVTGGMHAYPPYDRMGRITLWLNNGSLSGKK